MPKAGRYNYPVRDVSDCVEYLRKGYESTHDHTFTRDGFAKAVSLSPKSGGYGVLLASLSSYGLIDSGDGTIRYTDLAKKILHGLENESENAHEIAVRNVKLFADIYDKYGDSVTDEQLRYFLREKAGVDISEESMVALEAGKILKKVSRYLKPMNLESNQKDEIQTNVEEIKTPSGVSMIQNSDTESFGAANDYGIWVKKDPAAIDFCLTQIEAIKAWLNHVKAKVKVTTSQAVTEGARGKGVKAT